MKLYILIAAFIGMAYTSTAQQTQNDNERKPTGKFTFANNGETITITDMIEGKTYTYPANDTLHYAMMRKLMPERPIMKDRSAPTDRKREDVVR
mgnify:FL=1